MKINIQDIILVIALSGFFVFAAISINTSNKKCYYKSKYIQEKNKLKTAYFTLFIYKHQLLKNDSIIKTLAEYSDMQKRIIIDDNERICEYINYIDSVDNK